MRLETLHALQFHGVNWLSKEQAIEMILVLIHHILTLWKNEKNVSWYDKTKIFSLQIYLYMLADIIHELNKLNNKFRKNYDDIISLEAAIDVSINTLKFNF